MSEGRRQEEKKKICVPIWTWVLYMQTMEAEFESYHDASVPCPMFPCAGSDLELSSIHLVRVNMAQG